MSATICITYHDEPLHLLQRALSSAGAQTVKPTEILVIDDGSDIAVTPTTTNSRVVRITNRGLPAARNTGLMLCRTEGIIFLDADDWIEPTFIEKTLPLLADADVVLVGLQEHGPTRNGTYMPGYDMPFDQVTLEQMWTMNRFYYCCLFRTQVVRECGGYNPLMAGAWNKNGGLEDWDLTLDLMTRGARYACVNEVLFNYSTANPQSMIHRSAGNRDALVREMKRHHRRT